MLHLVGGRFGQGEGLGLEVLPAEAGQVGVQCGSGGGGQHDVMMLIICSVHFGWLAALLWVFVGQVVLFCFLRGGGGQQGRLMEERGGSTIIY